jgi:hypothetical protein
MAAGLLRPNECVVSYLLAEIPIDFGNLTAIKSELNYKARINIMN